MGTVLGKDITVGKNSNGALEVFIIGVDGCIYHIGQTAPNNGWGNWIRLGLTTQKAKEFGLGTNADGRLELFNVGTDNGIYHYWQNSPNGTWSSRGRLGTTSNFAVKLAVGRNADGRLEIFTIGTDSRTYHFWQTAPSNGWSQEAPFGASNDYAKEIAVGSNKDGRLEVFTISSGNQIYHYWQTAPSNGWSNKSRLGTFFTFAKKLAVTQNADGRLEVFLIGLDNQVYNFWQTSPNNGWSSMGSKPIRCVSMNAILVGLDKFSNADRQEVSDSLTSSRASYAQVGLVIDSIQWYVINSSESNGRENIDSNGEAEALTSEWTVPNNALDIFFVLTYAGSVIGLSKVDGPCDKDSKGMTGSVVAIEGSPYTTGFVLSHEAAHYLGLQHTNNDSTNLMYPYVPNGGKLTAAQGGKMKGHCFVHSI